MKKRNVFALFFFMSMICVNTTRASMLRQLLISCSRCFQQNATRVLPMAATPVTRFYSSDETRYCKEKGKACSKKRCKKEKPRVENEEKKETKPHLKEAGC